MTAALQEGEWSAARPGRTLPPGKTRYPFYRRLDGPQGWSGRAENLVPTGIRSRTVQPVVSRYTDWATAPPHTHTHTVRDWNGYISDDIATFVDKSVRDEPYYNPHPTPTSTTEKRSAKCRHGSIPGTCWQFYLPLCPWYCSLVISGKQLWTVWQLNRRTSERGDRLLAMCTDTSTQSGLHIAPKCVVHDDDDDDDASDDDRHKVLSNISQSNNDSLSQPVSIPLHGHRSDVWRDYFLRTPTQHNTLLSALTSQ